MNTKEFSNSFDILYNNIMSNAAPGINEYEKSVLLTKAQDEIIKNYFNPKGNKYQEGVDDSTKRQVSFSNLISVKDGTPITEQTGFDPRSVMYKMPEDVFLILNETLITSSGLRQVIPISFDEYTRLMSKPYKEPLKYQAWRLTTGDPNSGDFIAQIIPHLDDNIVRYSVRYIRRPKPIVLVDLSSEYGDVSINGVSTVSECELNPVVHEEILQRAVELAKVVYTGDANGLLQLGQRSE